MYAKSKETTQTILDAARALFSEKHYADVTINEIVTHANISKGALYHHFLGKEDVYLKMMHHYLAQIEESTKDAAQNSIGSARERLYQSALNFLQLSNELLGVLRLVRRDINLFDPPMRNELIRAYQLAVPQQVEIIIQDGIAAGELRAIDARLLSWELVAVMEVASHPYGRSIIGGPEDMAGFVTNLFLDGAIA